MTVGTVYNRARPSEILLVEDNEGDVLLTQKAFGKAKISNNLTVAVDGEHALAILRREGEYHNAARPDLILLDLNLPRISGREVLAEIKSDSALRAIPVVVLSSSTAELDVIQSYNMHANSYLVKPISLDKFIDVVSTLEKFWFTLTVLPDEADVLGSAAHMF